jgi:NAD(P)-dependent dehydrogenase (short-subunit alcohol dehydrogenase family)
MAHVPQQTGLNALFNVCGLVVVITGSCGLVGRRLAAAFHAAGAKLVIVDLAGPDPVALARDIGGETLGVNCNVTDTAQVTSLVAASVQAFSRVDVLITCHQHKAAGFLESKAEHFPEALWDAIIEVNLKGTFLLCREFGQQMIAQGAGSIINVASVYGVVSSNPGLYLTNSMGNPVAYSASKGGVIMLSKYLAAYWAKYGVRVNCITPHGVYNLHEDTFLATFSAMSPMGRMMTPDEVVGATLFLASAASSYVTGSNVIVDGGWTAW